MGAPRRDRRVLITPEGVALELSLAGRGERLIAFAIDLALIAAGITVFYFVAESFAVRGGTTAAARTAALFAAFLVRNGYFLHFELAWRGRTPGKRFVGLRVIDRSGGELTPGAILARNLIREAEFFLPLSLFLSLDSDAGTWRQLALGGWAALAASLPLWSRERLRAGDLIAGTGVIALPGRRLSPDLTMPPAPAARPRTFVFTGAQLAKYGAFELQVLEEILRRPDDEAAGRLLADVCGRICRRIGWRETVPPGEARRFLTDFYAAERDDLERGKLYGKLRADKNSPAR
ncbi:MAG: RDD family protein [Planctomycetota bacterium]|nr:RDD family protein [Planctomycetota bacterium]